MKYFEVFKAGNYPQGKFTKEEVQELAKNYDPSFCEAPITLDHEQKFDKVPQAGTEPMWLMFI